jgi:exo-beta-1,3-glucanase (GH17 family)
VILKKLRKEDGSILVFGIGLAVTAIMIFTLAVNVATLWLTRNVLDGIADGAALAAAQAIDSDAVYESGVGGNLKLNSSQAKNRVKQYVQTGNIKSQVRELGIKSVVVSGTSVTVTLQAKPNLAFGYLLPISSPVVVSSAKAINKVR